MKTIVLIAVGLMMVGCGSDGVSGQSPEPETGGSKGAGGTPPVIVATGGVQGSGGVPTTGGGGTGGTTSIGGANGSGGAPMCLPPNAECTQDTNACCNGTTCIIDVARPNGPATCAANCLKDADCVSGCCATLKNGLAKVCSAPSFCQAACLQPGASCAGDVNACCSGSTCVTDSAGSTCAAICTAHAQCTSKCCAPLNNSLQYVCSPVRYCQ